jgi:hypothetical protein
VADQAKLLKLMDSRIAESIAKWRVSPEFAAMKAEIEEMFNHGSACDRKHPKGTPCPGGVGGLAALLDD